VIVDLPRCRMCNSSPIEPERVDFENYRMTFVVDRAFRQALENAGR